MNNATKKIDYRFKILYAVAMIMVVAGHTSGGAVSALLSGWFPYGGIHLALFVFCSGYFYLNSSEIPLGTYIKKKIKTLLIPLYVYNFVYGIIVQMLRHKGFEIGEDFTLFNLFVAPITSGHQFGYNMSGWFVAPLFMVEVFNASLRKIFKSFKITIPEMAYFIINILLGIIGNQLACKGFLYSGWIVLVRMLYFVPFYGLGIYYKVALEKYEKRIPSFWYFSVIYFIKFVIVYSYGRMIIYNPAWCNNFTEGPIMPIIIGFLGIALWMRIAIIMEPVIGKSKWINLIADNTYSIMINQFLGFMIVKTVYAYISKSGFAFSDFDWISYKTDVWWYYVPKGVAHSLIIYVVFGIAFSIAVQKCIDMILKIIREKLPMKDKIS